MPMKLPKGFQRRKSSGNALEEVLNPPAGGDGSFRVLDRPTRDGKSFDGGITLKLGRDEPPRPPPKDSYQRHEDDVFSSVRPDAGNRGSGATERSHSTAPNGSAASSARLSSSSTNPSSIDTNAQTVGHKNLNDIPAPPPASAKPSFLRDSTRSFSFGVGKKSSPASSPGGLPPTGSIQRDRNVTSSTTSTASTATPPRLFDSDLALENSELDGFGNMFDHIGTSSQPQAPRPVASPELLSSPPAYPPSSYPSAAASRLHRGSVPQSIRTDRNQVVESSPYSWASHDSHEGLIRSPSPSKTITQLSPPKARDSYFTTSNHSPLPPQRRPIPEKQKSMDASVPSLQRAPAATEETTLLSTSPSLPQHGRESPRSLRRDSFDPSIMADAELATMYQETKTITPKPVSTNKVMTPAQWEKYKQQKEMDRRLGALSDDSGSEPGDNYEDDDEVEQKKKNSNQRQKQQANLAVYRQQMRKVTGETTLQSRPESSFGIATYGNGSLGDLNNRFSNLTTDSRRSGGKSSGEDDGDDDEDIPLGILAAHGFPNKNKPPTRLATSPSNPSLRPVSQLQSSPSPGTPSMIEPASKGGRLPPFARQLPQDPYFGAGLVNPSNRESMAAQSLSPSALGSGPSTAHPIHPAGLVGVIAGEERARAARRGSPNPAGNYDPPGMVRSTTTGAIPGMGYPVMGAMPMMSPAEQAQAQMSLQMQQMMEMQAQWMQQMQSMMGVPGGPGSQMGAPSMGAPSVYGMSVQRPQSMHGGGPSFPGNPRTMSTLNPGMAPWSSTPSFIPSINVNGNYASSIAPSERSNVGLAPRYRPVSVVADVETHSSRRASTFTSNSYQPWNSKNSGPQMARHGAKPSVNMVGRRSPLARQDDEDDEQGWAEMKKRKEKKQKSWALRKGTNGFEDLYSHAT
ncbi:hypothetical protein, variant [Exophiala mesophila]|uniref:Uncharacterized protein n=1 Tax=Exophiala mesophila TaxID=212818 RepID=A0A0D1ZIC3_EXOME|nr:uncharacterized protein PV10_02131 [Exophiala mesophila]XP_016225932.1 hypothetical protein, variant [Exophiala mesophila]KIV94357.1 hypothetical protein PV10_02131 [Exophiala mesophila]KIV94358.1 hypothetical protein, variant [Exophiala mesophila]